MKSLSLALLVFMGVSCATTSGALADDPCSDREAQTAACNSLDLAAHSAYNRSHDYCQLMFPAPTAHSQCRLEALYRLQEAIRAVEACHTRVAALCG